MIDESLRKRLRKLEESRPPSLDQEARARIAKNVLSERGQNERTKWGLVFFGLPIAAAAALAIAFVVPWGTSSEPEHQATTESPSTLRCDAWELFPARSLESAGNGSETVSLGHRGQLEIAAGSTVRWDVTSPCQTDLLLDSGEVRVEANDLGGGSLRVRTPDGDVSVRGTVFTVRYVAKATDASDAASGKEMQVQVEHGRVLVSDEGDELGEVFTGEHVRLVGRDLVAIVPAVEEPAATIESPVRPIVATVDAPEGQQNDSGDVQEPPPTNLGEMLRDARNVWQSDRARARIIFAEAAGREPTAYVELARRELSARSPAAARTAASAYRRAAPSGPLVQESWFIEAQAAQRMGDRAALERAVNALDRQGSPYRARAHALLEDSEAPR